MPPGRHVIPIFNPLDLFPCLWSSGEQNQSIKWLDPATQLLALNGNRFLDNPPFLSRSKPQPGKKGERRPFLHSHPSFSHVQWGADGKKWKQTCQIILVHMGAVWVGVQSVDCPGSWTKLPFLDLWHVYIYYLLSSLRSDKVLLVVWLL